MAKRSKRKNKTRQLLLSLVVLLLVGAGIWFSLNHFLSGKHYTAEDFEMKDGYLTCKTPGSQLGIDVSEYQGEIDWDAVRDAGVEFVFVRVGLRSARDGIIREDQRAIENLTGAREAGLEVGAYFFSQASTKTEAREEADFLLNLLQEQELDLPVAFNWETVEGITYDITKEKVTTITKTFCDRIEAAGYESMVYFNKDHARRYFDVTQLKDYNIWYAQYADYPDTTCQPKYWQYTDQGTVPGIEEKVDLNLYLPG